MSRSPQEIVKSEADNTQEKGYKGKMLKGNPAINDISVKVQEFADHPVRVRAYPEGNGKIMAQLGYHGAGAVSDDNGYDQRREYHYNAQWFPYQAPADVFQQPENYMEVFHFTVPEGNGVLRHNTVKVIRIDRIILLAHHLPVIIMKSLRISRRLLVVGILVYVLIIFTIR